MQNSGNFSISEIIQLAQSPAGQQLIQMLQRNGGPELQQAMEKAASGDYTQAKQAITSLLKDPEAKQLLEQLGR